MTPFARLVRNAVQKVAGTFYEGPRPPDRLSTVVDEFVRLHPKATKDQWIAFARLHAQQAYQDGYVRGYERGERDLDEVVPDYPPELMADVEGAGWRDLPAGPDFENPYEAEEELHEPVDLLPPELEPGFQPGRSPRNTALKGR